MRLAVTGHRPDKLGGYSTAVYRKLRDFAKSELILLKPERVLTGMALGWDQAVADACVDLEIPFVACVPFKGQEAIWPAESQLHYRELVALAAETIYVSDGGYAAWKMIVRNHFMVDHVEQLLALWDGSKGGTGECVTYAAKKGLLTVNCWSRWADFTGVAA